MKPYDYKNRKGEKAMSWQDFYDYCVDLAKKVEGYDAELIIGIARGGLYPATQLSHLTQKEFIPVKLSRRVNDVVVRDQPVWSLKPPKEVNGKKVLLVDEITDTGDTLLIAKQEILEMGAKEVKTATIFAHSHAKSKPDYVALVTDKLIINPWDSKILKNGKLIKNPEYDIHTNGSIPAAIPTNYAYFEVTVKILLNKGGKILALTTAGGFLDFPGGRIDQTEVEMPFAEVLKREIAEELGEDIKFEVNNLAFVTRRQYTKNGQVYRTLAIFYEAQYISGEIILSDEHTVGEWVNPTDLLSKNIKYATPDEEEQLKTFFAKV